MTRTRHRSLTTAVITMVVAALLAAGCSRTSTSEPPATTSGSDSSPRNPAVERPDDEIAIEVVSSQPDRVTGSEAMIRVTPPRGQSVENLRVMLEDRDVTSQLTPGDGALQGVVEGFVEGTNTLTAVLDRWTSTQRVRAWPTTGPMISGPHTTLLVCSTEDHGLGEPTDDNCSAPTRVWWRYVDAGGSLHDLDDPGNLPPDVARVSFESDGGRYEGPFVIRHERGVVNRSIYDIVTIEPDPARAGDLDRTPTPFGLVIPSTRLVYRFGAGCGFTRGQGRATVDPEEVGLLARGYSLATATFNTGAVQCNDVVSAETAMMVKERYIERFGPPRATIGQGFSGGAMQVHLITQNYPGLLDGAVAVEGFPDAVTVLNGAADCLALQRWFSTPAGSALSADQRAAVSGLATSTTCEGWEHTLGSFLDPTAGCDPGIKASDRYNADTNPTGVRCSVYDAAVNIYGTDSQTGTTLRPLDNVGVQYGLAALNEGKITFEQFVALNRDIGGFDADGQPQRERHEASPDALSAAYETGRVSAGVGDQNSVPIIEVDIWNDPTGDVHDHVRPFTLRDRITFGASPALAPGIQIWTRQPPSAQAAQANTYIATVTTEAIDAVADWLDALEDSRLPRDEALADTRPVEAADNCLVPGSTEPTRGLHVWDEPGPCLRNFPSSGTPRIAAGAPLADDVIKCQLKAIDPEDYEAGLTNQQYEQLLEIFPRGVCDWTSPGAGQVAPSMPDRTFEDVVTPEQLA